jgi:hypothetical protein
VKSERHYTQALGYSFGLASEAALHGCRFFHLSLLTSHFPARSESRGTDAIRIMSVDRDNTAVLLANFTMRFRRGDGEFRGCSSSTATWFIQNRHGVVPTLASTRSSNSPHCFRIGHDLKRFGDRFHPLCRDQISDDFIPLRDRNQITLRFFQKSRQLSLSFRNRVRRSHATTI